MIPYKSISLAQEMGPTNVQTFNQPYGPQNQ